MEKKQYINPEQEIVQIHTMQMLASSPDPEANGLDPDASPVSAGDLDAREFDF